MRILRWTGLILSGLGLIMLTIPLSNGIKLITDGDSAGIFSIVLSGIVFGAFVLIAVGAGCMYGEARNAADQRAGWQTGNGLLGASTFVFGFMAIRIVLAGVVDSLMQSEYVLLGMFGLLTILSFMGWWLTRADTPASEGNVN